MMIYTSKNKPRMLQCGHSYCTTCIQNMIECSKNSCPTCNRSFPSNINDIPVNFALMEAMPSFLAEMLTVRILILGDTNVGKTSFSKCFETGKKLNTDQSIVTTIQPDIFKSIEKVDGMYIMVQVWDTPGQIQTNNLFSSYFKNVHSCILLFDITDEKSFENVKYWHHMFREINAEAPIILGGNKCDLPKERQKVTITMIKRYMEKYDGINGFLHVSCINNVNIKAIVKKATLDAIQVKKLLLRDDKVTLKLTTITPKKLCYC